MKEKTLVLIKPDAVQRGLIGEIVTRFERCGMKIVALKMHYADAKKAGEHYADDEAWLKSVGEKTIESYKKKGIAFNKTALEQGRIVREGLMQFLAMSPIIALILEGHNAVAHARKIVGPTAPAEAAPGTIRGDYTFDTFKLADDSNRPIQNLIHASGTVQEAKREIDVWFSKEEIYSWKRVDEDLLYRKVEL